MSCTFRGVIEPESGALIREPQQSGISTCVVMLGGCIAHHPNHPSTLYFYSISYRHGSSPLPTHPVPDCAPLATSDLQLHAVPCRQPRVPRRLLTTFTLTSSPRTRARVSPGNSDTPITHPDPGPCHQFYQLQWEVVGSDKPLAVGHRRHVTDVLLGSYHIPRPDFPLWRSMRSNPLTDRRGAMILLSLLAYRCPDEWLNGEQVQCGPKGTAAQVLP